MMTDIEIAQSTPLCPIAEIAAKAGIPATAAEPYGSNKAKITEDGIFLEQLEKNPARFLPKTAPGMKPAVDIDLDEGMDKVREKVAAMGLNEPS